MTDRIETLVALFEQKKIDRRQLIGALVAAAAVGGADVQGASSVFDGRVWNHVTLAVSDVERARAFYERLLGVSVMYDGPAHGSQMYDMRMHGDCFISFTKSDTPRIDHVCVGVPNFDAAKAAAEVAKAFPDVKQRGNAPSRTGQPLAWNSIFVTDPDGNTIQIADTKYQLDGRH